MNRILLLGVAVGIGGCGSPLHLGYDYGRAFSQAMTAQADLTRPTAANEQYALYGIEGVKIRLLVQQSSTQATTGTATLTSGQ